MLRIAQCTDSFLPVTDGVGRVVYEYAQSLAGAGHACYVVTPQRDIGYRGGYPFEIADYFSVRVPGAAQLRYGVAVLDRHYTSRMDRVALDLVHAHSPGSSGQEACRLAEKHHIPLIGTFHPKYFDDLYRYVRLGPLADAAVRAAAEFYTRCDEVWTVTNQAADTLRSAGYRGRIEIVASGTEQAEVTPEDLNLAQSMFHLCAAPMLLCVGQIDFNKNLARAIEAAAILSARNVPFQLLFVGEGPDEKRARALVRERGLYGAVRFLGPVTDDRVLRALYQMAALFVYPALHLTAGLVVHEAAACGTPSVVMRGSAAAEVVRDGENGLVCDDSATSLADAIAHCLAHPDERETLGKNARATIPQPWSRVMDGVLARYKALTEREKYRLTRKRGPFRREMEAVGETLEKRTLDLIGRFLRQDMQHVYAYPSRPPRTRRPPERPSVPLPRATPESQGVSSEALRKLFTAVDADSDAHVNGMIVLRHGKVIAEGAWTPYDNGLPRQLYSLSKSVTSTAVGMLVGEGKLDLDEYLVDIFPDKAPENPLHPAHKLMVRHLLTMSTGSEFNEIGSALGADWVYEFLHANTKFEPGTAFLYNSMDTYMLAAVLHEKTGQTLTEYLRTRLYEPLGIRSFDWETCPRGVEKGGWGLSLALEDVAKLGRLYLAGGTWETGKGRVLLLAPEWIAEATSVQIDTPGGECTNGYGYQIWMAPRAGGFLFNGAFGQYMLALPDLDVVVAVASGTSRLFAQGNLMQYVDDAFAACQGGPLPEDAAAHAALNETLARLSVQKRAPFFDANIAEAPLAALASHLDGRVYTFDKNIAGLFPTNLMSVHNNFSPGLAHLVFRRRGDALSITFDEGIAQNELLFVQGAYARATVSMRGEQHEVAANLQCESLGAGEWRLHLNAHFLGTPFTRRVRLSIRGDALTALFDESPTVQDASMMLLELAGVTRIEIVRALLPMLQREKLQSRLRTYTTVTTQGRL